MTTAQSNRVPLPSRNPLPLSSAQEAQVRELYYKRVRNLCANEIRGTPPHPLAEPHSYHETPLLNANPQTSHPALTTVHSPQPGSAVLNG